MFCLGPTKETFQAEATGPEPGYMEEEEAVEHARFQEQRQSSALHEAERVRQKK